MTPQIFPGLKAQPKLMNPAIFVGLPVLKQRFYVSNLIPADLPVKIIATVFKYYGQDHLSAGSKSHERIFVVPRQVAMYFIRQRTYLTVKQIGKLFNRHYTTVIYASDTVLDLCDTNKDFAEQISELNAILLSA